MRKLWQENLLGVNDTEEGPIAAPTDRSHRSSWKLTEKRKAEWRLIEATLTIWHSIWPREKDNLRANFESKNLENWKCDPQWPTVMIACYVHGTKLVDTA